MESHRATQGCQGKLNMPNIGRVVGFPYTFLFDFSRPIRTFYRDDFVACVLQLKSAGIVRQISLIGGSVRKQIINMNQTDCKYRHEVRSRGWWHLKSVAVLQVTFHALCFDAVVRLGPSCHQLPEQDSIRPLDSAHANQSTHITNINRYSYDSILDDYITKRGISADTMCSTNTVHSF